jgi:hypothetical protein
VARAEGLYSGHRRCSAGPEPAHGGLLRARVHPYSSPGGLATRGLDYLASVGPETPLGARGRKGGRRPKLSPEQQQIAADMARGGSPITTIAQTLGCSRHTVYKALAHARHTLLEAGAGELAEAAE